MNWELQIFKLDLEKAEEPEIKLPISTGSSKKQEFQKNIYFCFIDYAKAFNCVGHNKLWKILKEMGLPDHLICLLRNLYAGQEATVRTEHGTTDWFQTGKGVHQGCILSLCLFNLYAKYVMHLNCGVGEDSWESLGLKGDPTSSSWSKSVLNIHCKNWCWSWNSNTLAIWCEDLIHLKRLWCWERL